MNAVLMITGRHECVLAYTWMGFAVRTIGPEDGVRSFDLHQKRREEDQMERFNMSMRKYLKEVGVTSQQAIDLRAWFGTQTPSSRHRPKLQVRMVLTA